MDLREVQRPLKQRYREDPAASQITLAARGGETDAPAACSVDIGRAVYEAQAHAGVGGPGTAACSGDLLLGALAACQEITLRMVAAAMGIELEALEVEAIGELDLRGTLGVDRQAPVGFSRIRCETRVAVKDDGRPDRARRLLENAERYCVVLNTLRQGVPVESKFALAPPQPTST